MSVHPERLEWLHATIFSHIVSGAHHIGSKCGNTQSAGRIRKGSANIRKGTASIAAES